MWSSEKETARDSKVELGIQEIHRKCLGRQGQLSSCYADYIPVQMKCEGGVQKEETQTSAQFGEVGAVPICKNNYQVQVSLLCSVIGWEQPRQSVPWCEEDVSQSVAAGGCQSPMLQTSGSFEGRSECISSILPQKESIK